MRFVGAIPVIFVRILAVAVGLLGFLFLWVALNLTRTPKLAYLIIYALATCLWIGCCLAAQSAWPSRSARSVRRVCSIAAVMAFVFFSSDIYSLPGISSVSRLEDAQLDPYAIVSVFTLAFPVIMAMLLYQLFVGCLLYCLHLPEDRSDSQRLWAARLSLGTIALYYYASFWMLFLTPFTRRHPHLRVYDSYPDFTPREVFLILFVTFLIPALVYMFGMDIAVWRIKTSHDAE